MTYLILLLVPFAIYQIRVLNNDQEIEISTFKKMVTLLLFFFSLLAPMFPILDIIKKFDITNSIFFSALFIASLAYLVFIINYTSKKIGE